MRVWDSCRRENWLKWHHFWALLNSRNHFASPQSPLLWCLRGPREGRHPVIRLRFSQSAASETTQGPPPHCHTGCRRYPGHQVPRPLSSSLFACSSFSPMCWCDPVYGTLSVVLGQSSVVSAFPAGVHTYFSCPPPVSRLLAWMYKIPKGKPPTHPIWNPDVDTQLHTYPLCLQRARASRIHRVGHWWPFPAHLKTISPSFHVLRLQSLGDLLTHIFPSPDLHTYFRHETLMAVTRYRIRPIYTIYYIL